MFMERAQDEGGITRGGGGGDEDKEEPEIDWEAVHEADWAHTLATERADPEYSRIQGNIDSALGAWYRESGQNYESIRDALGLSESEIEGRGEAESHDGVCDRGGRE